MRAIPWQTASEPTKGTNPTRISWAVTFLIIALIAAVLGFGVLAGTAMEIAKILFFVFIVLFVLSFFVGGRRSPPV